MLNIEGATIHTFIDLMDDVRPFKSHIEKLDSTAKQFFEKEFSRPAFNSTRQQIKQRLYTVLSIPSFDRLFSAPRSKINFFDALNDGKIIMVNTAKDLLKQDGTAIFGRFILALIEHAIMERAVLSEAERTPTFIYVDEAQDLFDESIETMLVQARKQNCGLILAHQNLVQLSTRLRAIVIGHTTIKLAGGVSDADARNLAADMHTDRDFLMSMKKDDSASHFALSLRNHTPRALDVSIQFGAIEKLSKLNEAQYDRLLESSRAVVAYSPEEEPEISYYSEPEEATPVKGELETQLVSSDHSGVQQQLCALAKTRGFAANIEYALQDGKRTDLALFGNGQKISIEISVTNHPDYELENIKKGLKAGFDHIWMLSDDAAHLEAITSLTLSSLSPADLACVSFGSTTNAETWIIQFPIPTTGQGELAGYTVETVLVAANSVEDQNYRLGLLSSQ